MPAPIATGQDVDLAGPSRVALCLAAGAAFWLSIACAGAAEPSAPAFEVTVEIEETAFEVRGT